MVIKGRRKRKCWWGGGDGLGFSWVEEGRGSMVLVWWVSSRDGDVSKCLWYYFVYCLSELEGFFDCLLLILLFVR